jgi:hypothetical protein
MTEQIPTPEESKRTVVERVEIAGNQLVDQVNRRPAWGSRSRVTQPERS